MMQRYILSSFFGICTAVDAARSVTIETDPRYQALPFCARDCLWNDNNIGDIAASISFIFPCYNSCYCSPDAIEEVLRSLRKCTSASSCCDTTDYTNAVALYYSYCNAQLPWSLPLPSEVGTAPPSSVSRSTALSTASWCSTAHFSPTSTIVTPKSSKTFKTSAVSRPTTILTPTQTAVANVTSENPTTKTARLLGIVLPCVGATIVISIISFCAWIVWRNKKKPNRGTKNVFGKKRHSDSTPLIIVQLTEHPRSEGSPAVDSIEEAYLSDQENDLTKARDNSVPPPYAP